MTQTTTHLKCERDTVTGDWIFSGRVDSFDLRALNLDRLDRAVIATPAQTAADHLQSLEIIFRRLHEQRQGQGIKPTTKGQ